MLRLDRCIALKWAVAIVVAVNCGTVWGSELSRTDPSQTNLQLEVVINDAPIGMIAGFVLNSRHRIGATPAELEDIGLRLRGKLPADRVVQLDDIPTLRYSYNERLQTIQIWVDNAYRKGKIFDLSAPSAPDQPRSQASWGAVVNYNLLASSNAIPSAFTFNGSSLTLDARAFSPYGTFQQSGIVRTGPQSFTDVVRLNTSFRYSDQDRLVSYTAGDTITGGLPWSRPVRIGGFQAQSNFSLRPDLVTMPLPSLSGSAAVPSTLDVYVNNMRTFSQDVPAGPFSLNNIPLVSGAGNAELVIRDSAGRETKSVLPFYASSSLLAPGLMSWSVEAGLPRLSYGSSSDAYVGSPIGSATLRKGIFDWMTVEAHAEGSPRLANGGVGAAFRTGNFGVAGVAVSASTADGDAGFQSYASYETKVFGFNIFASTQRTFGSYQDIASSTAQLALAAQNFSQGALGFFNYLPPGYVAASTRAYGFSVYTSALPPRALDRITFSVPLPFDEKANVSATFLHMRDSSAGVSNIVTATYTRALPLGASFFTTAFHDAGTNKNTGLFAGLSMPLGPSASISTSVSKGQGGFSGSVDAIKSLGPEPGSYGWRVRDAEGAVADRQASVSYRSRYGTIQAGASEVGSNTSAALELRGSITTMDGGVFLSTWIDDGFAVVNVGAPGVEVLNENRPAGVTDAQGMLLIPTLRAYQKNRITVDPVNLPVDAEMEKTHDVVAPADRAGALVKFAVRDNSASALVTFVKADGSFVRAGSRGRLDGRNEFVVGYDGQAFIRDLSASNRISIEAVDGSCGAAFGFSARRGEQVKIGPVVCR